MADGTYKLIKENSGGTFDEKSVLAEDGKVLGFDSSLNPIMIEPGSGESLTGRIETSTAWTLALTDASLYIRCNNPDAITVTIPKNKVVAFPKWTVITLSQIGAGVVTVAPVDGDVTLNAYDSGYSTAGQYWGVQLVKVDTDVWDLIAGV